MKVAAHAPSSYEYVEGWGMAVGECARVLRPRSLEEVRECFARARREGATLTLRGAGCSYGDASTSSRGHVLELTRMDRILGFDEEFGVAILEPGVTVGSLWKHALARGFWPTVVSGTMFPTVGGIAAMNIHGKNNFATGTVGDHTLEFDLLAPSGELHTCNRERESELFHAAIGGLGLHGVFTRIALRTRRVHSGQLEVRGVSCHHLGEMMDAFEAWRPRADYLVGWIDAFGRGESLGRGLLHVGRYLAPGEDPEPEASRRIDRQELPTRLFGLLPKDQVWRLLRLLNCDPGMRLVNALKYQLGRVEGMQGPYRQSHAAFNFLLDYLPNWKWAYGRRERRGLIQHQLFLPKEVARESLVEVLERCLARGFPSYLCVLKRHRPDPFWLTHGLDGFSLALDFPVRPERRLALWAFCRELADLALERGGRFYAAKDLVLRPGDFERFLDPARLDAFRRLKRELDPEGLLESDLSRRLGLIPAV
jgi:decaprenylphospho-beta-D-ribofuranose 2-oxidase